MNGCEKSSSPEPSSAYAFTRANMCTRSRGAADGEGTRHFFLICSTNHEEHLHILARLAILAHGTDLMERLDAVETPEDAIAAIRDCETEYRK